MTRLLYLGWIAAVLFIFGSIVLGGMLPDYDPVSQTVSEIGEYGSLLEVHWQILGLSVGSLLLLFAMGILAFSKQRQLSYVPALFVFFAAVSEIGIALYPSPHPMHNVFGLSMTLGYLTPMMFCLFWKKNLGSSFKRLSAISFALIVLGIFLNLSPAFVPDLYPLEYYGLVQRFLLFVFYMYLAYVSVTLNSEHRSGSR